MLGRAVVALLLGGCGGATPAPASEPAGNAASAAASVGTLRDVDWANARLDVEMADTPEWRTFSGGRAERGSVDDDTYELFVMGEPAFADVTGDGTDEALLPLALDNTAYGGGHGRGWRVLVLAGDADRRRSLGDVPIGDCEPDQILVKRGWLYILTPYDATDGGSCTGGLRLEHKVRWDGEQLVDPDGEPVD